jgi:hypothetical protein
VVDEEGFGELPPHVSHYPRGTFRAVDSTSNDGVDLRAQSKRVIGSTLEFNGIRLRNR